MPKNRFGIALVGIMLATAMIFTGCSTTPASSGQHPTPVVQSESQSTSEVVPESTPVPEDTTPEKENVKLSTVRLNIDTGENRLQLTDKLKFPIDNGVMAVFDIETPVKEYTYGDIFSGELVLGPVREKAKNITSVIISQALNQWNDFYGQGEEQVNEATGRRYAITTMYADNTYLTEIDDGTAVLVQDYLPKAVWDKIKDVGNLVDEGVEIINAHTELSEHNIGEYQQNVVVTLNGSQFFNKENFNGVSIVDISPNKIMMQYASGDSFIICIDNEFSVGATATVKSGSVGKETWGRLTFESADYISETPVIAYAKGLSDGTVITVVSGSKNGDFTIDLKTVAESLLC